MVGWLTVLGAVSNEKPERITPFSILPDAKKSYAILRFPVMGFLLLSFLTLLGFTGLEALLAVWTHRKLGFGPREVALFIVILGITNGAVQGGVAGRVVRLFGEARTAYASLIFLSSGACLFAFSQTLLPALTAMCLVAIGLGLYNPVSQSLFSASISQLSQGQGFGALQSAASLARILGPLWASAVWGGMGDMAPGFVALGLFLTVLFGYWVLLSRIKPARLVRKGREKRARRKAN